MKKKVLIFIEDGSLTFDNRVKQEARALADNGWNVTVISPKYPEDPFFEELGPNLRSYHYPKPNAVSAVGHIFEHSLTLLAGGALTGWVALRHGYSVFHACNPMDTLWMIALPYKLLGKKFLYDQHDLCPELYLSRGDGKEGGLFHKALLLLEKASYRAADASIATNESYKRVAIERGGMDSDQVFVVRSGPYVGRFKNTEPRSDLKQDGEILVGYLGNMNLHDGVDHLLRAAKALSDENRRTDIKFVLVGAGSLQPSLVGLAKEMGLEGTVRFTGRLPEDEMMEVMNACDLCVQPDPHTPLNDRSTMNKVLEYMALEKPVVSYDLTETRVSCGDAALYARANDVGDLAAKIVQLADDPGLRTEMGAKGRRRLEEKLSWEHSIPNLMAAYEAVSR